MAIPVISLAQSPDAVAAAIKAAGEAHGFFYAVDHGVPAALVEGQYAWAAKLFALPREEKLAISMFNSPTRRGYESIGDQTLDLAAKPDQKESFYCGVPYAPDHPYVKAGIAFYGDNQWPASLPGMAAHTARYIDAMQKLAERLMRDMARSLGLAPDWFDRTMADPMVTLRLLRYPPHPADAPADLFGAGAHTDWGSITILAQDDLGGLQVQAADGSWIDAAPVKGSFVVNFGDMIPRWTNGRYRSNPHRVVNANASGRDRYSIPFFYSPNYDARIEPVPGSVAPGQAPAFDACTAGEHMAEMYRKTYAKAA